jgi:molybdopterin molybdotransferase
MNDKTVTVNTALESILKSVIPLGSESISILDAGGRIIYDDIISDSDIPPFNNSAMDGYAILFEDSTSASLDNPKKLKIIGEIKAGDDYYKKILTNNKAVRIMTGAPVPPGANAVIQFEDTTEEDDVVKIFREVKKLENIRFAGEDIKNGSIVFSNGHMLKSVDIGLLASLNHSDVKVYKRPEVAIIATGDEIVEPGTVIKSGQIRNSNSYAIFSEVKKYNAVPSYLGIAGDTVKETRKKLEHALNSDIVITTGGVSKGKYDFVTDVMAELGINVVFEGVKMKPGMPCVFGKKNNVLLFGLPGNPVSAMISFIQFVGPAILKMMGAKKIEKPFVNAVLKEDIKKKAGRTHFIRGYFTIENGDMHVSTTGPQGSGILRSMSEANCLIVLPMNVEKVNSGEKVLIQLINHEEI